MSVAFRPVRWLIAPAVILLCAGASPPAIPTEPPPPHCVQEKVVKTFVGPTIKTIAPGRRIVAIVWVLGNGHTYTSQTGDDDPVAGKKPEKASDELRPAGTMVTLCSSKNADGTYYRFIRTKDKTNRVVTLVSTVSK